MSTTSTPLIPFLFLLLLTISRVERGSCVPANYTSPNSSDFTCWTCVKDNDCRDVEVLLYNDNIYPQWAEKCNVTGPEKPTCYAFYDQKKKMVQQRGCYRHTANFIEIEDEEYRRMRCVNDTRTNQYGWTLCTCHSDSNCNNWLKREMVLRNGDQVSVSRGVYESKVPAFLMEVLIFGLLGWRLARDNVS